MQRDRTIDNLRGAAMMAMMVIHACSYYLTDRTTLLIWDNLQWAVPVFIFCSFYLFFNRTKEIKAEDFFFYLKKRITRLLVPYYVFLGVIFPLFFVFEKKYFNLQYFLSNIFLYGGISFNWLVLLFVYLIFLMPAILAMKKNKMLFYGFLAFSILSSLYFIFIKYNFRITMWLPWVTYAYFTMFFIKNRSNTKKLLLLGIGSLVLFFALRVVEVNIGHNLTHYENKYPPTLYHLSFGFFWVIILYWLSVAKVFTYFKFDRILNFLSVNSYSLYFIHILVIFTISWLHLMPPSWPIFFLEIIGLSSLIQYGINKLSRLAGS